MAEIKLLRREVKRLPRVCMVCGRRAKTEVDKKFTWAPQWAYLVGGIILLLILQKKMVVRAPLCAEHRNHWTKRNLIMWGSFAGVAVIGIIAFLLISMAANKGGNASDAAGGLACMVGAFLFIGWLILAVILQNTAIRTTEITDRTITLKGVCDEFVDAVENEEEDDEEEEVRPTKRPAPKDRGSDAVYDRDPKKRPPQKDRGSDAVYDPDSKRRREPRRREPDED